MPRIWRKTAIFTQQLLFRTRGITISKYKSFVLCIGLLISCSSWAETDKYVIDVRQKHAFIQFKISHFGFSYVLGRFQKFKGAFCYDPKNLAASQIIIEIDVASLDTMDAERDKQIRSEDYLNVKAFPKATFISTAFEELEDGVTKLGGDLTLHGVKQPISMQVTRLGLGDDPWGKHRAGFESKFRISAADFGLNYYLGNAAKEIEIYVTLEGARTKYANIECPPL